MNNIKAIRMREGLSQQQLAEMSKISINTLKKYESGERHPKIEQLFKIASVLNVSVYDLVMLDSDNMLNEEVIPAKKNDDIIELQKNIAKLLTSNNLPTYKELSEYFFLSINKLSKRGQLIALSYISNLLDLDDLRLS